MHCTPCDEMLPEDYTGEYRILCCPVKPHIRMKVSSAHIAVHCFVIWKNILLYICIKHKYTLYTIQPSNCLACNATNCNIHRNENVNRWMGWLYLSLYLSLSLKGECKQMDGMIGEASKGDPLVQLVLHSVYGFSYTYVCTMYLYSHAHLFTLMFVRILTCTLILVLHLRLHF